MWGLLTNIFKGFNISEAMKQTDDWKLTKEETIRYQLEWLRAMPTGFQLAQRLIGVAFSGIFLLLITITFGVLLSGQNIDKLMEFIRVTMTQPLMIIFSLFFGGGLLNSFKNGGRGWSQQVSIDKASSTENKPIVKQNRRKSRVIRKLKKNNL